MGVMTEPAADARVRGWASHDIALYEAQAPRLLALAAALAGPSDADDVVSSAVLRSFTTPGWGQVANPQAYLTRAVVNEVRARHRSALRRSAREARYAPRDEPVRDPEAPDADLLAALARLPLQQRAVIFLTYWGDQAPAAIAAELDISEGSVRKYLNRARSTLRKGLQ